MLSSTLETALINGQALQLTCLSLMSASFLVKPDICDHDSVRQMKERLTGTVDIHRRQSGPRQLISIALYRIPVRHVHTLDTSHLPAQYMAVRSSHCYIIILRVSLDHEAIKTRAAI